GSQIPLAHAVPWQLRRHAPQLRPSWLTSVSHPLSARPSQSARPAGQAALVGGGRSDRQPAAAIRAAEARRIGARARNRLRILSNGARAIPPPSFLQPTRPILLE